MNSTDKQQLTSIFPLARFEEPLSAHCTFRIGGPADAFIEIPSLDAKTIKRLTELLKFLKSNSIPVFILGGGSNVLFHDKGFRGVVIQIKSNEIKFKAKVVEVDAGVNLQFLIGKANEKGFQNLLQLTGIPGTVGGAVRGNAGANGMEIKDALISATILDTKTSTIKKFSNKSLAFKYRTSKIKKSATQTKANNPPPLIVLKAEFRLSKTSEALKKDPSLLAKLNARRMETQPWGLSAGSFFKNPTPTKHPDLTPDQFKAGYLIDQCGLKGAKLKGVGISNKHANFFQNLNDPRHPATQKDLLALAKKARTAVYSKFKIRLEEEVQVVPQTTKITKNSRK